MAMRIECKHFESRSYPNGDTVRKCGLDLAPDAPWRCPEPCRGYERRRVDVAWTHGSLVVPPTPPEPESVEEGTAAAVLDEAEAILNAVGREIAEELDSDRRRSGQRWWHRLMRVVWRRS